MSTTLASSLLIDEFKMRAEAIGARVERVPGKPEAIATLTALLREEGVADTNGSWAACAPCPLLTAEDHAQLAAAVAGFRTDVSRELAAAAKVGVSQVDWAMANTGTVVQACDEVAQRLVSTLPLVHIVFLPTAAVQPDLPSVLERVHPEKAAYLAFVTGPSRTSDIERVLTIGVHGPERFIIILVDDAEVSA